MLTAEAIYKSYKQHKVPHGVHAPCHNCPVCHAQSLAEYATPKDSGLSTVKGVSSYERHVYTVLSYMYPNSMLVFEVHLPMQAALLPDWHAACDVYLPHMGLIIQVDGEQHFSTEERELLDRRCDFTVLLSTWPGVRGLLRIHYNDVSVAHIHISKAHAACAAGHNRFVMYSKSYRFKDLYV